MQDTPESSRRPGATIVRALVALVLVAAGAAWYAREHALQYLQEKFGTLDPAQVVVLRTPGGFLEVSTLVKSEEFGWRSSYTCLWRDCGWLMGERVGRIRVPVHYTYRIPLAQSWTLRLDGDSYVLGVPAPQPLLPPGLDTAKAEFTSTQGGLLAPSAAANQANLLKNLGPELAQRAQRVDYLQQQMPAAEKTVKEFAEKWMKEQLKSPARPVRVEFGSAGDG